MNLEVSAASLARDPVFGLELTGVSELITVYGSVDHAVTSAGRP